MVWRITSSALWRPARKFSALLTLLAGMAVVLLLPAGKLAADDVFVPADSSTRRLMRDAEELLTQQKYDQAVRYLQRIVEEGDDYFLTPEKEPGDENRREPVFLDQGFKSAARKHLLALPADAKQSYELQFGAQARRKLDAAVATASTPALEELFRQYFPTQAGHDAALLLGWRYLDHGRPRAALECFQRLADTPGAERFEPLLSLKIAAALQRTGRSREAQQYLANVKTQHPDARLKGFAGDVRLGDASLMQMLALFGGPAGQETRQGDEDWIMPGGNPSRTAVNRGSGPSLRSRWRVPMVNDPETLELIQQLQGAFREGSIPSVPAIQPLIVNGLAIARTADYLLAIDLKTGKRMWYVTGLHDPYEDAGQFDASQLEQRLWNDSTYGTFSSDGEAVFLVQGGSPGSDDQPRVFFPNGRMGSAGGLNNRLQAYEVRHSQGKLRWEVGGTDGLAEPRLAGAYFVGPPLPLEGSLYTMLEAQGELRLAALDAATGKLQWSQSLVAEVDREGDPRHRMRGVSPSYADGVLVCPTAGTSVVAVDLATRSLRWGASFPVERNARFSRLNMLQRRLDIRQPRAADGWLSSTAVVAAGKIVATPPGTNHLICLNLKDGRQHLEPIDREDGLYVAGVDETQIVIAGSSSLRSVAAENGAERWKTDLPAGEAPSGRGYQTQGRYYLPLTTGEVWSIDLKDGKVLEKIKSQRSQVLGNLVCHNGRVISQSADHIDCFFQVDYARASVKETLKNNPNDAQALALQGELLLEEGKLNDAILALRHSYKSEQDPHTAALLAESLLRGLEQDFTANRGVAQELESLLETSPQRLEYLRLMAVGLHAAGERVPAFDFYLRLSSFPWEPDSLEPAAENLHVRRDRWIRAQLDDLYAATDEPQRAQLDQRINEQFEQAASSDDSQSLRRFLTSFGGHEVGNRARRLLVDRLADQGSLLERELLLRELAASDSPDLQAQATARLAQLFDQANRPADAALFYSRLSAKFADQVCLDGKTGQGLVAALAVDSQVRQLLHSDGPTWPLGQVQQRVHPKAGSIQRAALFDLDGSENDAMQETVHWDQNRQVLLGRDSLGQERWRLPLTDVNRRVYYGSHNVKNAARAYGHVLFISLGYDLLAIDTLGTGRQPRVLWRTRLDETIPGVRAAGFGVRTRMVRMAWGVQRFYLADGFGKPMGLLGPLSGELVCFQRGSELHAMDPLSGKLLWKRSGFRPGSTIFGDEQRIFVAGPDETDAEVLRARDGRLLGKRHMPQGDQIIATFGRRLLTWSPGNGHTRVSLIDPWIGEALWHRDFSLDAKAALIDRAALGVMENTGRFAVLNVETGTLEIDAAVQQEPNLTGIYVLRDTDRDILITNRPAENDPKIGNVSAVSGGTEINGLVYGFDRATGKQLWSTRIRGQAILLDQPSESPILAFASNQRRVRGGNRATSYMSAAFMDKRNGRMVGEHETPGSISYYDVTANAQENLVNIDLQREIVTLRLTDKPIEDQPGPEVKDAGEKDANGDPQENKKGGKDTNN